VELIYTLARGGRRSSAALAAKLLILSLQKTGFEGDICVLCDFDDPIFAAERKKVRQIRVPFEFGSQNYKDDAYWHHFFLKDFQDSGINKIIYIDPNTLALRNVSGISLHLQAEHPILISAFHPPREEPSESEVDDSPCGLVIFNAQSAFSTLQTIIDNRAPEQDVPKSHLITSDFCPRSRKRVFYTQTVLSLGKSSNLHELSSETILVQALIPAAPPQVKLKLLWSFYLGWIYLDAPELLIDIFEP
jgi:hypothetical protein